MFGFDEKTITFRSHIYNLCGFLIGVLYLQRNAWMSVKGSATWIGTQTRGVALPPWEYLKPNTSAAVPLVKPGAHLAKPARTRALR